MTQRLPRLDHLRACAAIMVVMWHFTQVWIPHSAVPSLAIYSLFEEGHTGVSFFSVISGFIFTQLYRDAELSYRGFAIKRFYRIAPLFLFVVFLSFYVSGWDAGGLAITLATTLVRGGLPSYAGPGWSV